MNIWAVYNLESYGFSKNSCISWDVGCWAYLTKSEKSFPVARWWSQLKSPYVWNTFTHLFPTRFNFYTFRRKMRKLGVPTPKLQDVSCLALLWIFRNIYKGKWMNACFPQISFLGLGRVPSGQRQRPLERDASPRTRHWCLVFLVQSTLDIFSIIQHNRLRKCQRNSHRMTLIHLAF